MSGLSSHFSWLRRSGRRRPPATLRSLMVEELESRRLLSGPGVPLHLDFGTADSPVAPGYVGVPLVAYNSTLGYGWASTAGLGALDRHTADPLTTDFHYGSNGTFLVNLANGAYDVTPILGDPAAVHDNV